MYIGDVAEIRSIKRQDEQDEIRMPVAIAMF
jgi:hypothetical protein